MELHFVKNEFRFSSGKMLVFLEKQKLLKQTLLEIYQNLIVQKMEKYLTDRVKTYMKNVSFLFHGIVHCSD